jgi:sugar phosphate isomerase/epimerase
MKPLNRRQFIETAGQVSCGIALASAGAVWASTPANRKMTMCLSCGAIGVSANQREAIELAKQYGFESVEASTDYLASRSQGELSDLLGELKAAGLVFGTAGLPVEFRQDEERFAQGMKGLPQKAAGLHRAGVTRVGTWLTPCHNSRTYLQNFKLHARRLQEMAAVLNDHGLRLGLEYVGTKTSREHGRYPFIHSLAEMRELIDEIGLGNVGLVLDSWHWWQADDTVKDLLALQNKDVVSVDLNDAPAGIDKDKQLDGQRELPLATGIIDAGAFLNALNQIGYDGPVRAEPFNKALNRMGKQEACAATAAALKQAFALVK